MPTQEPELSFEENREGAHIESPQMRGLTGWLIRRGFAHDERAAQGILIGVAVLAIALAVFYPSLVGVGHSGAGKIPPGATVVNEPGMPPRLVAPAP